MSDEPEPGEAGLVRLCAELNFKHSLVCEANEMRALTLGALLQTAECHDQVAAGRERAAERALRGALRDRFLVDADRARSMAATARRLYAVVDAIPLEARRQTAIP